MPVLAAIAALGAAMGAGAVLALQVGMNATLGRAVSHPLWATLISLVGSVLIVALILAALRPAAPGAATAAASPWWAWLGGVGGAVYITLSVMLAPRLGAAAFTAAVVAGQMAAALALDRYGLAGFDARALTPPRLVGAALVVAGMALLTVRA